jgi:hypothetical protein
MPEVHVGCMQGKRDRNSPCNFIHTAYLTGEG